MLLDESSREFFHDLDIEKVDCYLILADLELVMERWAEFEERSVGRRIFRLGFDLALSRRKSLFVVVSH